MKSLTGIAELKKSVESGPANPVIGNSSRLDFIDGLRGLAALYVVYFHIVKSFAGTLPSGLWWSLGFLRHGRIAVDLFIVISGYCLMLPLSRSGASHLKGGFGVFIKRRARRILPPYYAALLLCLVVFIFSSGTWRSLHGIHDAVWEENYATANWLSHIFLIHNWFSKWSIGIDAPMWSIAVEWQIYFIFAILLLPIWRRFGNASVIVAGISIGVIPCLIAGNPSGLGRMCPWYVGLFAMGMVAAVLCFSSDPESTSNRRSFSWKWLSILLVVALCIWLANVDDESGWWMVGGDILVGAASACSLVWAGMLTREEARTAQPLVVRFLQGRWIVLLGSFSYSLYLVHTPILGKLRPFLNALHLSQIGNLLFLLFVSVPITVLFSYLFHRIFELPFMHYKSRIRQADRIEKVELDPAVALP